MTLAEQVADAYVAVAHANHYMVGVVLPLTDGTLDDARQVLIKRQNAGAPFGASHKRLDRALDLIDYAIAHNAK